MSMTDLVIPQIKNDVDIAWKKKIEQKPLVSNENKIKKERNKKKYSLWGLSQSALSPNSKHIWAKKKKLMEKRKIWVGFNLV